VQNTIISFYRKSIKIYHYVITNKSEKSIELLLEHPKEVNKLVGSVSLIVEECYHGTEKEKNKIEVKTEYVTGGNTQSGNYGLNFTIPPRTISHLVLHSQFVDKTTELLRDYNLSKRILEEGPLAAQLHGVLAPYWKLVKQISELEQKLKAEKDLLGELENSQSRARSNLNAIREHDKQHRYAEQLDKLEDQINQGHTKIKEINLQLNASRDNLKVTGESLHFDSASNTNTPMQI